MKAKSESEKVKIISITIPVEIYNKIEELRNQRQMTRSRYYKEALVRSLENEGKDS